MSKRKNALRDTMGDKIFYVINGFFLLLLALIIIYPLYFIIIASISDPDAVLGGEVILYPVRITFEGFAKIMERGDVWRGYLNTIIYTLLTVVLSLIVTIPAGWALSRKTLPGKKGFMIYFIIPMFFGGGLIPFYNVMSSLRLVNRSAISDIINLEEHLTGTHLLTFLYINLCDKTGNLRTYLHVLHSLECSRISSLQVSIRSSNSTYRILIVAEIWLTLTSTAT